MSVFSTSKKSRAVAALFAPLLGLVFTLVAASSASAQSIVNQCANARVAAPGDLCTANITEFSNGLAYYALAAAVVGIMVSSVLWALGSKGQNPGQELTGKRGLIVCFAAAFCIGALGPFITKIQAMSSELDTNGAYTQPTGGGSGPSGGGTSGNAGGANQGRDSAQSTGGGR